MEYIRVTSDSVSLTISPLRIRQDGNTLLSAHTRTAAAALCSSTAAFGAAQYSRNRAEKKHEEIEANIETSRF